MWSCLKPKNYLKVYLTGIYKEETFNLLQKYNKIYKTINRFKSYSVFEYSKIHVPFCFNIVLLEA